MIGSLKVTTSRGSHHYFWGWFLLETKFEDVTLLDQGDGKCGSDCDPTLVTTSCLSPCHRHMAWPRFLDSSPVGFLGSGHSETFSVGKGESLSRGCSPPVSHDSPLNPKTVPRKQQGVYSCGGNPIGFLCLLNTNYQLQLVGAESVVGNPQLPSAGSARGSIPTTNPDHQLSDLKLTRGSPQNQTPPVLLADVGPLLNQSSICLRIYIFFPCWFEREAISTFFF